MDNNETWNTERLRNASSSWSLRADKKLLEMLEKMHQVFQNPYVIETIARTTNTSERLKTLTDDLENASLSLDLVNNRFMGLSNTQFVENLVQEDDVEIIKRVDEKDDEIVVKSPEKEKENQNDKLKNISRSLDVLKSMCEQIEISPDSDSDSDTEESNKSNTILRLKDPYEDFQLPPIIGSEKWLSIYRDDDVEMDGDKSEDEDEFTFVPAESDRNKPKTFPVPTSLYTPSQSSLSTSCENDQSDDGKWNRDISHPEDNVEQNIKPTMEKAPQMLAKPSDFAAELAKKLGGNLPPSKVADTRPEEKPKPKQLPSFKPTLTEISAQARRVTGNIFDDEPPPLDVSENAPADDDFRYPARDETDDFMSTNIFQSSSKTDNLFGHKPHFGGLFDDVPDEDEGYERINKLPSKKTENRKSKGLFDDFDDPEDSMFTNKTKDEKPKHTTVQKPAGGLFDDDDDEENDDLFKNVKQIENKEVKPAISKSEKPKKSLFGDSNSDDDDLFNAIKNTSTKISANTSKTNLGTQTLATVGSIQNKQSKKSSLFGDNSDSDDDLFKSLRMPKKNNSETIKKSDEKTPSSTQSNPKTDDQKVIKIEQQKQSIPEKKNVISEIPIAKSKTSSIENVSQSLKSEINKTNIKTEPPSLGSDEWDEESTSSKPKQSVEPLKDHKNDHLVPVNQNIPPPLKNQKQDVPLPENTIDTDNELFSKQKNTSLFDDDEKSNSELFPKSRTNDQRKFLFDDGPPPLDDEKSIKKNTNSLFDEDDDDDLFSSIRNITKSTSKLFDDGGKCTTKVDIFSDEPPDLPNDYTYIKTVNPSPTKDSSAFKFPIEEKSNLETPNLSEDKSSSNIKPTVTENPSNEKPQLKIKPKPPTINQEKPSQENKAADDINTLNSAVPNTESKPTVKPKPEISNSNKSDTSNENILDAKTVITNDEKPSNNPSERKPMSLPIKPMSSKRDDEIKEDILSPSVSDIKSSLFKQNTEVLPKSPSPTKTVGKLQTNININVKALIPGATIKIPKPVKNNQEESEVITKSVSFEDESIEENKIITKSVSFEDESTEEKLPDRILCNTAAKERVKIPVKRRPSTRKARHEAIRKSAADMVFNFGETIPNSDTDFVASLPNSPNEIKQTVDSASDIKENISKNISKAIVIPEKTEQSDLFDILRGEVQSTPKTEKKNQSIDNSNKKSDLFDILREEAQSTPKITSTNPEIEKKSEPVDNFNKSDLFDSLREEVQDTSKIAPTQPKVEKKNQPVDKSDKKSDLFDIFRKDNQDTVKTSTSLFADDDSPTDLFKVAKTKTPKPEKKSSNLFGDSDDDDLNLFSKSAKNKQISDGLDLFSKTKTVLNITKENDNIVNKAKKSIPYSSSSHSDKKGVTDSSDLFSKSAKNKQNSDDLDLFSKTETASTKENDTTNKTKKSITSNSNPDKKNVSDNLDLFSKSNSTRKSIFDDDTDLFAPKSDKTVEVAKKTKNTSLFGGDDEDEDNSLLFKPKEGSLWSSKSATKSKSLFGDDDDDDDFDLFKPKKVTVSNKAPSTSSNSSKQQSSASFSAEVTKEDPLSSFQDD